jgi:short-subunit dehydrogenase
VAKQYAAEGHQVWISARNEELLASIAFDHKRLLPLPVDITDDQTLISAVTQIQTHSPLLDKVIINAGTCEYIDSYEIERDKIRRVMETNFFGALNVVNAVMPLLRQTKTINPSSNPQLVFVSSSVTYQALPRAGAYGASKAALRYFAETLRADIVHEGIDVRVISPGFVKTPLTDKNDFPMPFLLTADDAAQRMIKGLESKKFDIHFPKRFTLGLKLLSILPDWIRLPLVAKASRHDVSKIESNHRHD